MSKKKVWIILGLIVILGTFLRSFRILETMGYGHDADLYSWIVKDISIDKHLRLIGQETSTIGIFIGPLFYYFLIPFYFLAGFDPVGSIFAVLVIGVLTIISYFFVFRKLFDQTTGLVAAFLQTTLPVRIGYDRWIVPTITVNLWCVWYLLTVFKLAGGQFNYMILAGLLTGLIWHVHIALAPLLILIPLAIIFSKKMPGLKQIGLFFVSFFLPMLPFFLFELRHSFSQIKHFFLSFLDTPINVYAGSKIYDVIKQSLGDNLLLNLTLLAGALLLPKLKIISIRFVVLLYVWVFSILAFFSISKKLISEYYFENIKTVLLFIAILYLSLIIKSKVKKIKSIGLGILLLILGFSFYYVINIPSVDNGYRDRTKIVQYIKKDSIQRNLPCLSITYITRPGEEFGYRYLFWINKIKMARDNFIIPNYTIVYPYTLATESARFRSGAVSVIPPDKEYNLDQVNETCPKLDYNQTHDFWGFTK